jgi:hypothetical protein
LSTATIVPSAARTTSGNSGPVARFDGDRVTVGLHVTAVSGTGPSMTVTVRWSHDGTVFGDADGAPQTFAAITAAKDAHLRVNVLGPFMRVDWAITGSSPSFTFSVTTFA